MTVKLYMHPVSTASRPVRLLIAEHKLPIEEKVVDLMTGEHQSDWYAAINPSKMLPTLEDGDFRMTESSAILKYLGSKYDLGVYPKDLQKRARVDEVMDWFNTQFYRDFGYNLAYPQMFPTHKRPSDEAQHATIQWGKERAEAWLKILDTNIIGKHGYVAGDTLTIADYFGACLVTVGEVIRCDFSHLPNVTRWLGNMKKLGSWASTNEVMYGFAGAVKDQPFKAIAP
jgi:glutathione S-transferase